MLHMLCGYPTTSGEAICNVHEALRFLVRSGIVVVRHPTNDQTSFRIALHAHSFSAISVASKLDASGLQVALVDTAGKLAMGSVRDFNNTELPLLLMHIRGIFYAART